MLPRDPWGVDDLMLPLAWTGGATIAALIIDRVIGEPPWKFHPVVWMGWYLGPVGNRIAPTKTQVKGKLGTKAALRFIGGALGWWVGAAVVMVVSVMGQHLLLRLPSWIGVPLVAAWLKTMMTWAMLADEVRNVEVELSRSLDAGRQRLLHLVSRDINDLDESMVSTRLLLYIHSHCHCVCTVSYGLNTYYMIVTGGLVLVPCMLPFFLIYVHPRSGRAR